MTQPDDPWPLVPILRDPALEEPQGGAEPPAGWVDARAERRHRWLAQQRQVERLAQRSILVWGRR
jgi:hypothetical protein